MAILLAENRGECCMYCVWTYHVESPDGEKKWVGQFELYDFIKDGWKVTSSSQELCLAMKEFDKINKFLTKERIRCLED